MAAKIGPAGPLLAKFSVKIGLAGPILGGTDFGVTDQATKPDTDTVNV